MLLFTPGATWSNDASKSSKTPEGWRSGSSKLQTATPTHPHFLNPNVDTQICQRLLSDFIMNRGIAAKRTNVMRAGLNRNMVMSGLQSLAAIGALFLSYRLVILALGQEALGLWSLLIALTLAVRLFDPTGAAVVGRFVAIAGKEQARGESAGPTAAQYVDTATLLLFALYAVLASAAFAPLGWLLHSQIDDPAQLNVALGVLPLLLGLMVANVVALSNSDAIDGIGRADMRAAIMIASYLVQLALVWWWLPLFGLAGLALAQMAQYGFITLASRAMLRRHISGLGWLPRHGSKAVARQMVGYGTKLQLSTLALLLADPLLRLLINHYAGLSLLGLYELASKLVVQLRALLVSAMMPLIPRFAAHGGSMGEEDQALFRKMVRLVKLVAAGIAAVAIAASPILGWTMLGRIDNELILLTAILAAGYFGNTVSLIHYLQAQASGRMFWNITGTFAIGAATVTFGPLLVPVMGPVAVIVGFALGLAFAGFIFIAGNACDRRS
jgi:O-antigen/teichoic acid export membrane protein